MKTLYTVQTADSWEFFATTIDVQEFHAGSTFTDRYLRMGDKATGRVRTYLNGETCTTQEFEIARAGALGLTA